MARICGAIDRLSRLLAGAVMLIVGILIAVMIFEVAMRRVFNTPTLWAFDVTYMLNGLIFIGASAYALRKNEHIRIDFLAARFSPVVRQSLEAGFFLILFLPAFGLLVTAAITQAWQAYATGVVERVSPWAPKVWPYYTGLAVGTAALWLQAAAHGLRSLLRLWEAVRPRAMPPSPNLAEATRND